MRNAHIITGNGRKMAVPPLAEYKRMLAIIETKEDAQDIQDAEHILARVKAGKEALVPGEVVRAITGGAHPVRAWRTHRAMTAAALAGKAGIAPRLPDPDRNPQAQGNHHRPARPRQSVAHGCGWFV